MIFFSILMKRWLLKNIKARVQKVYPIYDPDVRNLLKSIPNLCPKRLKNHTLYSPCKGVPPSLPRVSTPLDWLLRSAPSPTISSLPLTSPSGFWSSHSSFTFWWPPHSNIAIIISIFPKNITNLFPPMRHHFHWQWLHACSFQ